LIWRSGASSVIGRLLECAVAGSSPDDAPPPRVLKLDLMTPDRVHFAFFFFQVMFFLSTWFPREVIECFFGDVRWLDALAEYLFVRGSFDPLPCPGRAPFSRVFLFLSDDLSFCIV